MARPKTTPLTAEELKQPHELTAPLISDRFTCPAGMSKAFLKDKEGNGLKVRVTANGAKAFVYEAKINGKMFSKTLGKFPLMPISEAQAKARELATTVKTDKKDPREVERQAREAKTKADADAAAQLEADAIAAAANAEAARVAAVTVAEVWAVYVEERRPHWGDLHYRDHIRKAAAGGIPFKRGTGTTVQGPLFELMALPLRDLTAPVIEAWAAKEAKTRQTSARLAWRMLKVFLGWCEEQAAYAPLMPAKNQAKTKKSREHLGKAGTKSDALQREQLAVWFDAVRKISNPTIAAYLQTLLLTGARPGEVIEIGWKDMNTKWKGLTIRDKVEGVRVIPLTPYVHSLLAALPRRTMRNKATRKQITNPWVFSSPTSETGHITEPNHAHTTACTVAGIDNLTLHGLRRSFKSLTEWLEVPAGVVAQLMGHKPSATAEKHYTVRPLDLLRVHHERIEAWILEQAGVVFDAKAAPGALRVVA